MISEEQNRIFNEFLSNCRAVYREPARPEEIRLFASEHHIHFSRQLQQWYLAADGAEGNQKLVYAPPVRNYLHGQSL